MKIGILTLYHNSKNYGGNLQAYALLKTVNTLFPEYDVEHVSCDPTIISREEKVKKLKESTIPEIIRVVISVTKRKIHNRLQNQNDKKLDKKLIKMREDAFFEFNKKIIKHTDIVYYNSDINKINDKYDLLIVGSDQVWNIGSYPNLFLLDNVSSSTKKISYAASLSKNELTKVQSEIFKNSLPKFDAISVRESNSIDLLNNICDKEIQWHLDPTLLLTASDWDQVTSPRMIDEEYIFCYFLGGDTKQREIVSQYAKNNNLKIVTLPYLLNHYRSCDDNFGDIQLYDVSPNQFLSLIKYSSYVFTDSFHAVVFSGIYHREFIVFEREGHSGMSSRIKTLMNLYETDNRFCEQITVNTLDYIGELEPIDYSSEKKMLNTKREESLEYLKNNITL